MAFNFFTISANCMGTFLSAGQIIPWGTEPNMHMYLNKSYNYYYYYAHKWRRASQLWLLASRISKLFYISSGSGVRKASLGGIFCAPFLSPTISALLSRRIALRRKAAVPVRFHGLIVEVEPLIGCTGVMSSSRSMH